MRSPEKIVIASKFFVSFFKFRIQGGQTGGETHQPRLAATERLLNRGAELVCWVLKQMPKLEVRFLQVLRCDVM